MKTRIPLPHALGLIALLSSSMAIEPSAVQAQTAAVSSSVQTTQSVVEQPIVDAATAARAQIAQFRQQLDGLSPIEARDALREYMETNFPGGIPIVKNASAANNRRLAQLANQPLPALKLPANATPAQAAYLRAHHQLAQALKDVGRTALAKNKALAPEQRRDILRNWMETQAASLAAQANQSDQAIAQESYGKMLQRRQSLAAAAASNAAHRLIGSNPQISAAIAAVRAQREAIGSEYGQIMAQPALVTPEQRRDAALQWYEANKERIDAAETAAVSLDQQGEQTTLPGNPP